MLAGMESASWNPLASQPFGDGACPQVPFLFEQSTRGRGASPHLIPWLFLSVTFSMILVNV